MTLTNLSIMLTEFLSNKNYVVTGAASGIGKGLVHTLLDLNANVLAIDIDGDKLQHLYGNHIQVECFNIDLSNFSEIENINKSRILKFGNVDGFVHCAGISCPLPLKALAAAEISKVIDINTISSLVLFKILANKKICSEKFSSVFISSVYSLVGSSSTVAYAASKGAVNSAVRSLALEYSNRGFRVNAIAPGFVKTEMFGKLQSDFGDDYEKRVEDLHPLGLGTVSDVVNPILFLLSPMAQWITGQVIPVDGGYTVL